MHMVLKSPVRHSNLVPVEENVHLCPEGFIAVFTLVVKF
jgi:hypothetical protein